MTNRWKKREMQSTVVSEAMSVAFRVLTGIKRLSDESASKDEDIWVIELSYICSWKRKPPSVILMPKINNRLARIEPMSDAWTIRIWFWTSAMMKMMSSTELPKLTFSKAAIVGLNRCARHSVAKVRRPASGITAMALSAKTTLGSIPAARTAIPAGTKIRRRFNHDLRKIFLKLSKIRLTMGCFCVFFSGSPSCCSSWAVEDATAPSNGSSALHGLKLCLCAVSWAHAFTLSGFRQ